MVTIYSELAPLNERDPVKGVSIIQSMAKDTKAAQDSGTEIQVHTFSPNEDAVVPSDEEIVSVDHDRQMGVTRVTTKRSYDPQRSADERSEREGSPVTPTYPASPGATTPPEVPPSTSYTWGSIDTSKVQNLEDLKRLGPPLAEQEASQMPQEAKDETEVATELQSDANAKSADPAHTPEKPADKADKSEAEAAGQSQAQKDLFKDSAKDSK